jgi:hypothetical protein
MDPGNAERRPVMEPDGAPKSLVGDTPILPNSTAPVNGSPVTTKVATAGPVITQVMTDPAPVVRFRVRWMHWSYSKWHQRDYHRRTAAAEQVARLLDDRHDPVVSVTLERVTL